MSTKKKYKTETRSESELDPINLKGGFFSGDMKPQAIGDERGSGYGFLELLIKERKPKRKIEKRRRY